MLQFTLEVQQRDQVWCDVAALVDTGSSVSLTGIKLVNYMLLSVQPLTPQE